MQIHVPEGRLLHADVWKALIAEAHQRASTSTRSTATRNSRRPSRHETVLSMVQAVVACIVMAEPVERFDGIHLDIELYLPEWQDLESRGRGGS